MLSADLSEFFAEDDVPVKVFNRECAILVHHIGAWVALLRQCGGAGIKINVSVAEIFAFKHVSMPVQEYFAGAQRGRRGSVVMVSVGCKNRKSVEPQIAVVGENRELENHLVYLGVTVASDCENVILICVE